LHGHDHEHVGITVRPSGTPHPRAEENDLQRVEPGDDPPNQFLYFRAINLSRYCDVRPPISSGYIIDNSSRVKAGQSSNRIAVILARRERMSTSWAGGRGGGEGDAGEKRRED
jgi:hypothetical protein